MWTGIPDDTMHREGVKDVLGFLDRGVLECGEQGEWFWVTRSAVFNVLVS